MADYYVDSAAGSDSTGDGSSGNPWKTIGRAIGPSPAITLSGTGDVLHIKGGLYFESVTLGLSPTSGGPLTIVGEDGLVEWFAWSNSTTPATSAALEASGQSYITVKNVRITGGVGSGAVGSCLNVAGTWSDWTVDGCEFLGGVSAGRANTLYFANSAASAMNLTVRKCGFLGVGQASTFAHVLIRSPLSSSEYNLNALVENCRLVGSSASIMHQQSGGSGSNWATGVRVQQCTILGAYRGVLVASSPALATPIGVYGTAFVGCSFGVNASTAGQMIEDGNYFWATTNRSNVDAGTHSDASSAPRINLSAERLTGANPRPYGEPLDGSPLIGAGNYGTPPADDFYGRTRPSPPSIGAIERNVFDTPIRIFQTES